MLQLDDLVVKKLQEKKKAVKVASSRSCVGGWEVIFIILQNPMFSRQPLRSPYIETRRSTTALSFRIRMHLPKVELPPTRVCPGYNAPIVAN